MDELEKQIAQIEQEEDPDYLDNLPNDLLDESTNYKEDSKKKEKKNKYTGSFPDLVDLVEDGGKTKFLLKDGSAKESVEIRNEIYFAPPKERLAFQLPDYARIEVAIGDVGDVSDVQRYGDVSFRLFEEIEKYHYDSAEVPDERLYILLAAWDLHTHFLEHFYYSPILFFGGLPEKGKSRLAKSLIAVSKRGITKASITDAQIIREASDQEATIFFDTTNFWQSVDKAGSTDVILSRYERGLKVARVLSPEKGKFEDMTYFTVFGPTIIASNEVIDQILGSRTISFVMKQSTRDFPDDLDEQKGYRLREKIIAFKVNNPQIKFESVKKIVPGRFGDITRTLHRIVRAFAPSKEETFIELIKDLQKKRKASMAQTLEGEIIQAVLNLKGEVYNGHLPAKLITNKINEDKSDREKYTYQRIGRKLDIMGFQKMTLHGGIVGIVWNEELNTSLAIEHNIDVEEETSPSPLTSQTPPTSPTSTNNNNIIISNNISDKEIENMFNE